MSRPYPFEREQVLMDSEKPDFVNGGVRAWCFESEAFQKKTANGVKDVPGGNAMILLELSTQDGKKRYESLSMKNLSILLHNVPGILNGMKNLDASRKAKADAAKVKAEEELKTATAAIQKTAPTLKAAGLIRSAIVQAMSTQYQNLTVDQVEAAVPKD